MVKTGIERWAHVLPKLKAERVHIIHHPRLKRVAAHSHVFFELTYVLSGTVEHTIDGKTSILQRGDFFLVDYGSVHSYRAPEKQSFSNIDCLFLPELLDPSLKGRKSLHDVFEHYLVNYNMQVLSQDPSQMVFHDSDGRILNILRLIQKEVEKREAGYTEMIRCHLIEILLLTIRLLKDASVASGTQKISSFVTAYVSKHYMEAISLTALSALMNYSLPYVSKCFKEEMGISFVEYLQSYRIKQAARLLLSGKGSLSDIAEQVGYHDVKFFSEVFKNVTGYPPAAFRKLRKE